MELEYVGRPRAVLPFLGNPHKVEEIYDMARDKSPDARKALMQLVCDILKVEVGARESELIADILIELLRQAEKDFRQALSLRLAGLDNVPLRLVLQLANDEIEIARPVLKDSPVLGEFDLIYIIKSKTPEYWAAVAERRNLTALVIDTLADTGDFNTALAMVKNGHIELTQHALLALSDLAQGTEVLSVPLLRRPEITPDVAGRLYNFVGEKMKEFIREHYPSMEIDLVDVVDKTAQSFHLETAQVGAPLNDNPVHGGWRREDLSVGVMLETLRRGQLHEFMAQFSVYTGIPLRDVNEMVVQRSGQKMALACKAFDINKPDFVSFFLLTGKVRDEGRMVDVTSISKASAYYERVDKTLALRILQGRI